MNKKDSNKNRTTVYITLISLIAIITSALITYILLELKFKDPISVSISDWIKLIIPIIGSAVIVIFAFLGVDRLKNFDERQDRLEKNLKEELNNKMETATTILEPKFEKILKDKVAVFSVSMKEYEDTMEVLGNRIKKYDNLIGDINVLRTVAEAIGNIEEAHNYITSQLSIDFSKNSSAWQKRTQELSILIQRVKNSEIKGDSSDYHNLAAELARHGYSDYACEVIIVGLKYYPYNVDLLSDSLQYVHTFENADDIASSSIQTLEYIGRNGWNWRAFTFYIDYLNDLDPNLSNKENLMSLLGDYKKVLPNDERAYMAEYETYLKFGDLESAKQSLVYAEENIKYTAQCSLTLSKIYCENGEYDKAIYSATRAIQSQAETQPSSSTGAAFAFRGFALDAKIHENMLIGENIDCAMVRKALDDYQMAQEMNYRHSNIDARIQILCKLLPNEDREVMQIKKLENKVNNLEKMFLSFIHSLSSSEDNE